MITDTELRIKGLKVLAKNLGELGAERFIALIRKEPFDYTIWRQTLVDDLENLSIEDISRKAEEARQLQG